MKAKRSLLIIAAVVVIAAIAIGGTLAYLTAETAAVTNTFTVGNVGLTLGETKNDFKMIPGNTIAKDPIVTILADSEDCYVFVKVVESTDLNNYIDYTIADGWIQLKDASDADVLGVYYRVVSATDTTKSFSVLTDDKVFVKKTVTQEMMNAVTANTASVELKFTAYAIQLSNTGSALEAWTELTK